MGLVGNAAKNLGRDVRKGAGKLFVPVALALTAGLAALLGAGFLTASAYLGLARVVGPAPATLLLGLGFALVAGGLFALARRPLPKADPVQEPPAPIGAGTSDVASLIGFTLAFVLARTIAKAKRD